MYGESNMESYVTICKIYSRWEFAADSGKSNRGCVLTERDGMGREMGGGSNGREYMYTYG